MTKPTNVTEASKHAPISNADYWGKIRRGDMPESLVPRSLRDLALMLGERLYGMQMTLPGHIMTADDTDTARAHLNGYQDALQDVLELLTDSDGEMLKHSTRPPEIVIEKTEVERDDRELHTVQYDRGSWTLFNSAGKILAKTSDHDVARSWAHEFNIEGAPNV